MNETLAVGFLTTIGRNVGDEFIREGVRAVLDEVGEPYRPYYVDKHDSRTLGLPCGDEVAGSGDKYLDSDVFIQCGAPVYWHLSEGKARSVDSEWHGWFWEQRALNAAIKGHPVFLNLGAGSCQPWGDDGSAFLEDAECTRFARLAAARSEVTVVRDPVASHILRTLEIAHVELPCPAFLAGARHPAARAGHGMIGVNLMPRAGHFDLDHDADPSRWHVEASRLVEDLRRVGPLVFVAHDEEEERFQARMSSGAERVFRSDCWQSYMDIYAGCRAVVANRVHGAVCAAGFGVPAMIIGNDSRALIGDYIGMPVLRAATVVAQEVSEALGALLRRRDRERERLVALRASTMGKYAELMKGLNVFGAAGDDAAHRPRRVLQVDAGFFDIERDREPGPDGKTAQALDRGIDSSVAPGSVLLDFAQGGNAGQLATLKGLSGSEHWGCWTDANLRRTCAIELVDPLPPRFELEFNLDAFGPNLGAPVKVRIGAFETDIVVPAQDSRITLEVSLDGPVHEIELVPPHPVSPTKAGHGNDNRRLGIGIRSMAIRRR